MAYIKLSYNSCNFILAEQGDILIHDPGNTKMVYKQLTRSIFEGKTGHRVKTIESSNMEYTVYYENNPIRINISEEV